MTHNETDFFVQFFECCKLYSIISLQLACKLPYSAMNPAGYHITASLLS